MKEIISGFVLALSLSVPAQAEMVETGWNASNSVGGETQVFIDTDSIQYSRNRVSFEHELVIRTPNGNVWNHFRDNVMADCYDKNYIIHNIGRYFVYEGRQSNRIYDSYNSTLEERTYRVVPGSLLASTLDFACGYIGF